MAIEDAVRLAMYNRALVEVLGEPSISSLTVNEPSRYVLDTVWDGGAVTAALTGAGFVFSLRDAQLDYNPDYEPDWGFQYVFDKPDDYICTHALCADELMSVPLLSRNITDRGGKWFSNLSTIYVTYASLSDEYGSDTSLWDQSFFDYLAREIAARAAMGITHSVNMKLSAEKERDEYRDKAYMVNGRNKPNEVIPPGKLVRSRMRGTNRVDRYN